MSKFPTIAVVVAAGSGSRFGGHLPKQYARLGGRPVLAHSLNTLANHPKIDAVAVVIHPEHMGFYEEVCSCSGLLPSAMSLSPSGTEGGGLLAADALATCNLQPATLLPPIIGGKERQDSVRLALEAIVPYGPARVLVHDAARPFVTAELIDRLLAVEGQAVIPALEVVDTVKKVLSPHPASPSRGEGYSQQTLLQAKQLRRTMTEAEKKLWRQLSAKQLGAKFRRQQPIGKYIADFCCADKALIVEVDGGQHGRAKDVARTQELEALGYRILRFWNNEVLENSEGVLHIIQEALTAPLPLREGQGEGCFLQTIDRRELFRIQTPQVFDFAALKKLHAEAKVAVTDDAALFEAAGLPMVMVVGDVQNEKITRMEDLQKMQQQLEAAMETRVGMGFDVHAFQKTESRGQKTEVVLCGVAIPHGKKLEGHSDADVGLHALVDALLGAMAEGDIGQHFPPSDAKWKGADSAQFVTYTRDLARQKGAVISHVDITLICEAPKVGPHREKMRARIAELLEIAPQRVSVKATTTEKLGAMGREEGIAAQAIATLKLPVC